MLLCVCVCAGNITRTVIALRTADSFCHCLVSLCPLVTQPDLCGSEHRPRPPALSHACLTGSPPSSSSTPCLPCQLGSRSQLPSFLALLASVNIQRCRWVWYGHKKPSTVDCAPWFAPTASGTSEGRKKKWTKGQSGCMKIRWREQTHTAAPHTKVTLCFHCTRRPKVTINIHCCRWVGLCRKAHWTMSATVAQICLTRVSANQSAGCEALWLFYLYTSCFSLLFSPSFLPPRCWES